MADRPRPPEDRLRRLVEGARRITRDLARQADAPLPDRVQITVPLHGPVDVAAAGVLAALRQALDAARPAGDPWRDGRVYCFRCNGVDCAHAAPPEITAVLRGYEPTGRPVWADFGQTCVARRLVDLDGLFADPPAVVGYIEVGGFTADLLREYGGDAPGWLLVGQAVVGLVPQDPRRRRDRDRGAVALQVVALRRPGAPLRLRLNVVGLDLDPVLDAAAEGPPRGPAEQLRRVVLGARRQVGKLGRRAATAEARGEAFDLEGATGSMLNRLRGDLLRVYAPREWRTQHAEDRHVGAERPTENALADARDAPGDRLLADTQRDTIIVLGRRNRAHVFTEAGRHVTSLRLQPGEVDRKTGRDRWRPLSTARIAAFRDAVRGPA